MKIGKWAPDILNFSSQIEVAFTALLIHLI